MSDITPTEFATNALMIEAELLLDVLEERDASSVPAQMDRLRWAIGLMLLPEGRKKEYVKDLLDKLRSYEAEHEKKATGKHVEALRPKSESELIAEAMKLGEPYKLAVKLIKGKYQIRRHGIFLSKHRNPVLLLEAMRKHCRIK